MMISMPDRLLQEVDRHAAEVGTSRSGFLRELAEAELSGHRRVRQHRTRDLLADPGEHGGRSAEALRELRDTR